MTVIFGNLTTAFTNFGAALASGQDTTAARDALNSEVAKDALYLVYIGIGMLATTYIYMYSWIYSGEMTTRRIREAYLRSVLRQNVAFFDKIGAGEVTTRITSDMHLIQEGISEKIPITFQFIAQFVCLVL
jgi:ATP-binding cassette subfamily B (MDR/TAP) protein 1